ncbi:Phage_integrase [Legionella londiniensis]|nr:Phage_integrase [Legionella londiniensis]
MPREGKAKVLSEAEFKRLLIVAKNAQMPERNIALIYCSFGLGYFYLFRSLNEVRDITRNWMKEYNEERPHESLGDMSPLDYRLIKNRSENSNYNWH